MHYILFIKKKDETSSLGSVASTPKCITAGKAFADKMEMQRRVLLNNLAKT